MRLFSEEVNYTSSNSPLNILQVENFDEIFFGVYEVEINGRKYVAEKVSEDNGNPIVSVIVENDGVSAEHSFVLVKGKQEIYFNPSSDPSAIINNIEESVEEDEIIAIIEESSIDDVVIDNKKQQILEEINKIKKDATKKSLEILEQNKLKKIQDIKNESARKQKALQKVLNESRESLVEEFIRVSNKIKKEIIFENDDRFDEIRSGIDLKIQDIANSLSESLKNDFNNSSKLFDTTIKRLVKELYEKNVNRKLDETLNNIASDVANKVSSIDKNLNKKLDRKADASLLEQVNREIDTIRDSNIELNNTINKGVQKALSRVGNIDKKIIEINENLEKKIAETEQEVIGYFDDKIQHIKEETLDITDETRSYFQNLFQESRDNLLSEIRQLKNEKPVEYIIESKNSEKIVKDWDTIEKEWNKKIHDKFENYKTDLRRYVAVYASGGGTNATQYQDGGTMNGNLTIVGAISASQYLGISIPSGGGGEYLPLSGGTVTGNVTINGAVSAGNLSAGDIYSNGNRVATVVNPTRTTLTGNGTLSSFTLSGADNLTNPSALIVAIDGALQEPSVDYTVNNGIITFTDPLANGAKAVVIAPTNTLQVGQLIPSDGSVTSAKLAPNLTITTPTINSGVLTSSTLSNSTLSNSTLTNALSINATSFSFGLSSRENFLNKLSNRFVYKNEVIPYAEIFDDFPTTIDSRFGTHRWISNSGTVAYYTAGGPTVANYWGAISLTTGTTLGNTANIYLGPSAGANGQTASRFNMSFQTCFCLSATSCEYRQSYAGGGSSYAIALIADTGVLQLEATNIGGAGVNTLTVASGLSISTGTFVAGTRYRLFYKPLSLTQCEVYFASAPWNSSTWTTLVDTTVTHPSVASAAVCAQPFVTVATKLNPGSAVAYLDWAAIRQEIQR